LDLEARVELEEVEVARSVDQELERAGAAIAPGAGRPQAGLVHRGARRLRQVRRRRLLDQLLVAALDRALAVAAHEHAPQAVRQDLDLDVARALQQALDVERAVAERRGGLALGDLEGGGKLLRALHPAHPPPPA